MRQPMVDLPSLVTKQFAEAPFAIIGPNSGFVQQRKHGIDPPLVTGQCVEQHPIFESWRLGTWLDQLAFCQAAFSDMPVEHAPIPNTDIWFTANEIREICEGLGTPEHQAELSVGVNQIGQLTTPFGMHVEHIGRATLISAKGGPRPNVPERKADPGFRPNPDNCNEFHGAATATSSWRRASSWPRHLAKKRLTTLRRLHANDHAAYSSRAIAYLRKGDLRRAFADVDRGQAVSWLTSGMTVGAAGPTVILAGSKVRIVSIRRDPHALEKGIANESQQGDQTDKCEKPVWHVLNLGSTLRAAIASDDRPNASTRDPTKC
ncbi:hypothetical protein HZZ13_32655 [Bradyrhizobium sp. CNPSo 4010]|uniref:Uncharacterized protein n=1 Tax=Bradyrhizobium agreste TaxID=2751811 RepID=A0ABS0PZ65_9BRAD|nr:hypothetical protein [Bradyrhizobium agreste]MBH5402507.1 hypothetical protein [Bradyrhizobium agreste]